MSKKAFLISIILSILIVSTITLLEYPVAREPFKEPFIDFYWRIEIPDFHPFLGEEEDLDSWWDSSYGYEHNYNKTIKKGEAE